MNETLTPEQAATTLAEATRWQDALVQRTEGISWMVWGAVTAGLIMTMGAVGVAELPDWLLFASWPPWVVLGYAMTHVLWHTARLTRPDIKAPSLWSYLVKSLIVVGVVLILHFLIQPEGMAGPLGLIGVGWLAVALLTPRLSARGRRVGLATGALIVLAAAALTLLPLTMMGGMLIAAAVTGTLPTLAGLYQAILG